MRRLIFFVSTHLARNPEDPGQTRTRAKQAAQLFQCLAKIAAKFDAVDAPVVLYAR